MQIHEITEGLFSNPFDYAGMAAKAASKLQQKGYGTAYQPTDAGKVWPEKYKAIQRDSAVQKYITGLIQAWQQQSKSSVTEAQDLSTVAPAVAGAPTQAEKEKFQQKVQAATGATTGATTPPPTPNAFQDWSDTQLASRVPGIGALITMDDVRKMPGLGERLTQALAKVTGSLGKPTEAVAIKEYLELAIAGIQAKSQEIKSQRAQATALGGKYARSTGNAQADAVLKAAGFRLP